MTTVGFHASHEQTPPSALLGAVSARTAGVVGTRADGLITINQPMETLRAVLDTFASKVLPELAS